MTAGTSSDPQPGNAAARWRSPAHMLLILLAAPCTLAAMAADTGCPAPAGSALDRMCSDSGARAVCRLANVADPVKVRGVRNAEISVGVLCGADAEDKSCASPQRLRLAGLPARLPQDDPDIADLLARHLELNLAAVDIDNDGRADLRVRAVQGSLQCAHDLYFRADAAGQWTRIDAPGFEIFSEDGRFCGDKLPQLLRWRKHTYLFERAPAGYRISLGLQDGLHPWCAPATAAGQH